MTRVLTGRVAYLSKKHYNRLVKIGGPILIIVVLILQTLSSVLMNLLPYGVLWKIYPLFHTRKWEKKGRVYREVFRIRAWKKYVPSLGCFDKKNMPAKPDDSYISKYILENLRAELCHATDIVFCLFALFFTRESSLWFIAAWAVCANIPCMMIQRYNRPRFIMALNGRDCDGNPLFVLFWKEDKMTEAIAL